MPELSQFDRYLSDDGPAALVIREWLMPVEGKGGVFFPATFAAGDGFRGGYNIDGDPGGRNVCLVDSVGSQANRMEPMFARDRYRELVPQIVIEAGDKQVSIFDAGHRAGDALLRSTALHDELRPALEDVLAGNAEPLARIAPTSLVFGAWDSRDTQAKLPRVVASTIRAFDVRPLTRSAVYIPPVDYAALDVFSEEDKAKGEANNKSPMAQRGFVHNPASAAHGGAIAEGGIRRDATLGLAALRRLHAGDDAAQTLALRRYVLGLALVALTGPTESYLRQGCTLVLDPEEMREYVEVYPDGSRPPCTIDHAAALEYARVAARAFGVGESRTVRFEPERARADLSDEKTKGKAKRGAKKGAAVADAGEES